MTKIKRISKILVAICFTISCLQLTNIYAASFSVGGSASSVGPGESFAVSVSLDGAGLFTFSGSNASVSTSSQFCDGSCSISATAGSSGTATVTVSASDVSGYDESPITGSQSVSVTINTPSNEGGSSSGGGANAPTPNKTPTSNTEDIKSSDNSLSSLVVSKGTLDPVFDSGTTEYKITLAADVTAVTIEATASDTKASVSGTGEQTVKPGDNKLEVVVTAENGSTKAYVVNAYVDEKPTSFLKMNGKDYGIVPNVESVTTPTGFEQTTISIDGKEVPAWKNSITNMTLVYLINEKSEKNFYIYENNVVTSIYKPIALLGYNLAIIDISSDIQERKGYTFGEVEIDGQMLPGWTFENEAFANFSLIYVMNENGEKAYYQYEKISNTLQPYSGAASVTQEEFEQQVSTNFMLWIAVALLGTASIIFVTLWIIQIRKNKKMPRRPRIDEEDEKPILQAENMEVEIPQKVNPMERNAQEERPQYHRKVADEKNEVRKREVDYGTQPFRFHDDFDDNELK